MVTYIINATKRLLAILLWLRINRLSSKPIVLVYTIGKVGSSAVYETIKSQCKDVNVLHLHYLSDFVETLKGQYQNTGIGSTPFHLYMSSCVRKSLSSLLRSRRKIYVISLIRDPIAFAISDVFQNPRFFAPDLKSLKQADTDRVLQLINDRIHSRSSLVYYNEWLRSELLGQFNFDIMASGFDVKRGYQEYSNGVATFLMIRLEDLTRVGVPALRDFLGCKSIKKMIDRNVRSDGSESVMYSETKSRIRFSREFLNAFYEDPVVKLFYSKDSIDRLIEKWANK